MASNAHHEVLFMPWVGLGTEIRVGPFKMIPLSKYSAPDARIQAFLDRLFARHVDHYGHPVSTIVVVSRNDALTPISPSDHKLARSAVDALFLSTISPDTIAAVTSNNRYLAPASADAYQLVSQQFQLGDDTIAIRVGGSIHAGTVDRLTISKPWDVGGGAGFPNGDFLAALGKLLVSRKYAMARERIFRSLEWFRHAHTVGDGLSPFTCAVMMTTAFEILFAIPDGRGKSASFRNAVESRLRRKDSKSESRAVTTPAGKTKTFTHSLAGWWANDFYHLRSRVVHGDSLKPATLRYRKWLSHLIVADLVYWQSIILELYELGLFGDTIRKLSRDWDRLSPNLPAGQYEQHLIDMFLSFPEIHRALGWLPPKRKRKK